MRGDRINRGEAAIRRHLNRGRQSTNGCDRCWGQGCPDCAPNQTTVAHIYNVVPLTFGRELVVPPWADLGHDDLPFCPTCTAPFENGEQTCSCDWTSALARNAA